MSVELDKADVSSASSNDSSMSDEEEQSSYELCNIISEAESARLHEQWAKSGGFSVSLGNFREHPLIHLYTKTIKKLLGGCEFARDVLEDVTSEDFAGRRPVVAAKTISGYGNAKDTTERRISSNTSGGGDIESISMNDVVYPPPVDEGIHKSVNPFAMLDCGVLVESSLWHFLPALVKQDGGLLSIKNEKPVIKVFNDDDIGLLSKLLKKNLRLNPTEKKKMCILLHSYLLTEDEQHERKRRDGKNGIAETRKTADLRQLLVNRSNYFLNAAGTRATKEIPVSDEHCREIFCYMYNKWTFNFLYDGYKGCKSLNLTSYQMQGWNLIQQVFPADMFKKCMVMMAKTLRVKETDVIASRSQIAAVDIDPVFFSEQYDEFNENGPKDRTAIGWYLRNFVFKFCERLFPKMKHMKMRLLWNKGTESKEWRDCIWHFDSPNDVLKTADAKDPAETSCSLIIPIEDDVTVEFGPKNSKLGDGAFTSVTKRAKVGQLFVIRCDSLHRSGRPAAMSSKDYGLRLHVSIAMDEKEQLLESANYWEGNPLVVSGLTSEEISLIKGEASENRADERSKGNDKEGTDEERAEGDDKGSTDDRIAESNEEEGRDNKESSVGGSGRKKTKNSDDERVTTRKSNKRKGSPKKVQDKGTPGKRKSGRPKKQARNTDE